MHVPVAYGWVGKRDRRTVLEDDLEDDSEARLLVVELLDEVAKGRGVKLRRRPVLQLRR